MPDFTPAQAIAGESAGLRRPFWREMPSAPGAARGMQPLAAPHGTEIS